jgi:hypothetical protein
VISENANDVTVSSTGQEMKAEAGSVAAGMANSRHGCRRRRGKYELEWRHGHEYSSRGRLMWKHRIIDRLNDLYHELVIDDETGEVVRDVFEPLSRHVDHGSAKFKKTTDSRSVR